jgi:hypothetical protein
MSLLTVVAAVGHVRSDSVSRRPYADGSAPADTRPPGGARLTDRVSRVRCYALTPKNAANGLAGVRNCVRNGLR